MRPNLENFKAFLSDKEVTRRCPCCGSEGYFTGGLTEGEAIAGLSYGVALSSEGLVEASPYMRPQISMICSNCGFVRLFDYQVVQEWMDYLHANRQKDEGDNEDR